MEIQTVILYIALFAFTPMKCSNTPYLFTPMECTKLTGTEISNKQFNDVLS